MHQFKQKYVKIKRSTVVQKYFALSSDLDENSNMSDGRNDETIDSISYSKVLSHLNIVAIFTYICNHGDFTVLM